MREQQVIDLEEEEPAAFEIRPVPLWARLVKAAIPASLGLAVSVSVLVAQYEKGVLLPHGAIPAALLAAAIWVAAKLFNETEKRILTVIATPIPTRTRALWACGYLLGFAVACGWAAWYQHAHDQLTTHWTKILPIALIGLFLAGRAWFIKEKTRPTSAAAAIAGRETAEAQAKSARLERFIFALLQPWWVRYPIAAGLLWFAATEISARPSKWGIPVLVSLLAVYFARELALVALAIGAIVLLFQGVAALPVSVAVIIGAVIIALALKR